MAEGSAIDDRPCKAPKATAVEVVPAGPSGSLGPVALVGAGPGDPELLTLKALRRLESADVVLHDSLISEDLLALVPKSADLISVGKRCGDPKDRGIQQIEIHDLMLAHSRRGRRVVRLKCGDPFVFGRGGEELEFLTKHGVPTEVVPGITSALAAGASSQVPLTHRALNSNYVQIVVGQCQARSLPDLDWHHMARSSTRSTVVFYMGLKALDSICKCLTDHGAEGSTPMAIVENASTPQERLVGGTIATLPERAKAERVDGPSIIFLGPTADFPSILEKLGGGSAGPARKRARLGEVGS